MGETPTTDHRHEYCDDLHDGLFAGAHCAECGESLAIIALGMNHRITPAGRMLCTEDGTHSDDLLHALHVMRWVIADDRIRSLAPSARNIIYAQYPSARPTS